MTKPVTLQTVGDYDLLAKLGLQLPGQYQGQMTVVFTPLMNIAGTRSGLACTQGGLPLPFPFSIPCDLLYDLSSFDATPVSPTLPLALSIPLPAAVGGGSVGFTPSINVGTMVIDGVSYPVLDMQVFGGPTIITLFRWLLALGFTLRMALSVRDWMGSGW